MAKEIALEVKNVSKTFHLPTEKSSGIKQAFINTVKGKRGYTKQHVLKDITFNVEKGDFFGIVGRNGSGKSTLLKIISQIYQPDKGSVKVNGSLVPFIELGVGFDSELTGRENVYLNGAMLGLSNKYIDSIYDEIVEFAELHDFMDQKLKNYSSGMQVRLAFSCAIRAQSDILVLDEVLAVGDEAFQRKCNEYFYKLKKEKKTIILVTHNMDAVRDFCNKAILIDQGKILDSGKANKVAASYSKIFQEEYANASSDQNKPIAQNKKKDVFVERVNIVQHGKKSPVINFLEGFSIKLNIVSDKQRDNLVLGIRTYHASGQLLSVFTTKYLPDGITLNKGDNVFKVDVQNIFTEGNYSIGVVVKQRQPDAFLFEDNDIAKFSIIGLDRSKYNPNGLIYPETTMEIDS